MSNVFCPSSNFGGYQAGVSAEETLKGSADACHMGNDWSMSMSVTTVHVRLGTCGNSGMRKRQVSLRIDVMIAGLGTCGFTSNERENLGVQTMQYVCLLEFVTVGSSKPFRCFPISTNSF